MSGFGGQNAFGFGGAGGSSASSGGNNNLIPVLLNLSDTNTYDVVTRKLTIPAGNINAGIVTLIADLYDPAGVYGAGNIVRSDGTNGGVNGLCYVNQGINAGVLNDANWALADVAGGNVGNVEIETLGNPSSLSTIHLTKFKVAVTNPLITPISLLSVLFKAAPFNAPMTEGQIALDMNTDVLVTGIGFLTLFNEGGISVKQYLSLA